MSRNGLLLYIVVFFACGPGGSRTSGSHTGGASTGFESHSADRAADAGTPVELASDASVERAGSFAEGPSGPPPDRPTRAIGGVVDVEVGSPIYSHSGCILHKSGAVSCWAGPNILGVYDRGRTEPIPGPWKVKGLEDAVALFETTRGHCAIRKSGKGLCWSGEQQGPIELDGLLALTGSGDFLCALRKDRTVHCSGNNYNGEIGRPPVRQGVAGGVRQAGWGKVPGVSNIVAISDTCAVRADGHLLCWGAHALRPIHDWRNTAELLRTLEPQVVSGIPRVSGIAVSQKYTCLLTQKGTVQCGQRKDFEKPVEWRVLDIAGVVELVAGLGGVVARTSKGGIYYWGPGPARNVVDGAEWDKRERDAFGTSKLRRIPGIAGARAVSASGSHVCAVTQDEHVLCWGHNEHGQLNNGTLEEKGTSYLVDFHPTLLAGPGEQVFGCKPSLDIRRSCPKLGARCALEPPPGYWDFGNNSGVRCDDECMRRALEEVNRRAVPACMCTCSKEYEKLRMADDKRYEGDPPP